MPKGTAFDLEAVKILEAKKTKKVGETGVTIFEPSEFKRFRLLGFCLASVAAEETIVLSDETTAFLVITIPKAPTMLNFNFPVQGYLSVKNKNKLILNTKTSEQEITGTLYGVEEAA